MPAVALLEPGAARSPELVLVDPAELDLLRAPPEGLVTVVEDRRQHVAPASEVDVADLALRLEDRAHEVRAACRRSGRPPGTRRRRARSAGRARPRSRPVAPAAARWSRRCPPCRGPASNENRTPPSSGRARPSAARAGRGRRRPLARGGPARGRGDRRRSSSRDLRRSRTFVGVRIRSQYATSTSSASTSCIARSTSDVLP